MTSKKKIAIGLVVVALFVGTVSACRPRLGSRTPSPARAVPAHAADFSVGYEAYQRGDYATALRIFRQLADQGDIDAQFILGTLYDVGQGVTQDYAAAIRWYRKAADQGNAKAQSNLGIMYDNVLGETQD